MTECPAGVKYVIDGVLCSNVSLGQKQAHMVVYVSCIDHIYATIIKMLW